jgi:DNA-binding CsgD family transcriptional regulator
MDMANAADGEKQHQHFRILPEEMRVLNESLIKGTRISEALKVIRKIEAIHAIFEDIDEININQIPGVALLSPLENAVVKLTITGCSSKEIAIQLKVSTGHVYNCRSVIRSKLDMPQDANFELWLTKNLKSEFGN